MLKFINDRCRQTHITQRIPIGSGKLLSKQQLCVGARWKLSAAADICGTYEIRKGGVFRIVRTGHSLFARIHLT